jgi:hypothetical protein
MVRAERENSAHFCWICLPIPQSGFGVLNEAGEALEYGFRVPIEASQYTVRAGSEWRVTGYSGSVAIDRQSLAIQRLTLSTNELPRDTALCEVRASAEYQGANAWGLLVPRESRSVQVKRDSSESETVATFSNCQERAEPVPARPPPASTAIPDGIFFEATLTSAIDTASAAAGDVISARLTKPIVSSSKVLAPAGATVTGRIVKMQHWVKRGNFRVSITFDRLDFDGVVTSFQARLAGKDGDLSFNAKEGYVVPKGFKASWVTGRIDTIPK